MGSDYAEDVLVGRSPRVCRPSSAVFAVDKTCLGVAADNAGGAGFVAEATCKGGMWAIRGGDRFPESRIRKYRSRIMGFRTPANREHDFEMLLQEEYDADLQGICFDQATNGQIGEVVSTKCAASASCSGNKSIRNGQGQNRPWRDEGTVARADLLCDVQADRACRKRPDDVRRVREGSIWRPEHGRLRPMRPIERVHARQCEE